MKRLLFLFAVLCFLPVSRADAKGRYPSDRRNRRSYTERAVPGPQSEYYPRSTCEAALGGMNAFEEEDWRYREPGPDDVGPEF